MNTIDLDASIAALLEKAARTRTIKGLEYSSSADRLSNFKAQARPLLSKFNSSHKIVNHRSLSKYDILRVYLNKHLASLDTILGQLAENDNKQIPIAVTLKGFAETPDSRFIDIINYICLLNAMIEEDNTPPTTP